MASPAIVFYQLAILMVWIINRNHKQPIRQAQPTLSRPVSISRYVVPETGVGASTQTHPIKRQFQDVIAAKQSTTAILRPAQAQKTSEQLSAKPVFVANRPVIDMVIKHRSQPLVQ